MRVLRKCERSEADRLEVQIMRAYKRKGQASMNRMLAAVGRPPLPEDERAIDYIHLRVERPRKAAYVAAAERAGKSLTQWIIDICDKASGYKEEDED